MIQVICRVLIHSLWQGLVFTVLTGLVMLATKRSAAAMRYRLLSVLLVAFLIVCGATFWYEWNVVQGEAVSARAGMRSGEGTVLSVWLRVVNRFCLEHAGMIVLGWFIIFSARCARMIGSVIYTQRLRHYGVSVPSVYWQDKVRQLCDQLALRRVVVLLESRLARVPMITGHLKPVILVPLGLLTHLPEEEIEAMLLHELAHIRRHDYLVNFLQHIAENLFFFNPGLLWISSLLRAERENCCDDMALAYTGNEMALVKALVSFKEYALRGTGVAVGFPSGKQGLLQRVLRIMHRRNKTLNRGEKLFFLASCLSVMILLHSAYSRGVPSGRIARNGGPVKERMVTAPAMQDDPGQKPAKDELTQKKRVLDRMLKEEDEAKRMWMLKNQKMEEHLRDLKEQVEREEIQRIDRAKIDGSKKDDRGKGDDRSENEELARMEADKSREKEAMDQLQLLRDKQQAILNEVQAAKNKEQAFLNDVGLTKLRQQALQDKQQAERNRNQAMLDILQAKKDQEQAQRDKLQSRADRLQAERDLFKAKMDRQQVLQDRQRGMQDRLQTDRDRSRTEPGRRSTP